jgi:hypothetical protein
MNLTVINNDSKELVCSNCISTKQMRESSYCTKTIILYEGQYIPGCMINLLKAEQRERNYLTCSTYNLGLYSVCEKCPLSCPQNKKNTNAFTDIINFISNILGLEEGKKKEIFCALEKLNTPDFKEIYSSLEKSSYSIKNALDNKFNSPDIAKKVLEIEGIKLKNEFEKLIFNGKISKEEARMLKADINSSANIEKLKLLINSMKLTNDKK